MKHYFTKLAPLAHVGMTYLVAQATCPCGYIVPRLKRVGFPPTHVIGVWVRGYDIPSFFSLTFLPPSSCAVLLCISASLRNMVFIRILGVKPTGATCWKYQKSRFIFPINIEGQGSVMEVWLMIRPVVVLPRTLQSPTQQGKIPIRATHNVAYLSTPTLSKLAMTASSRYRPQAWQDKATIQ